MFVELQDKLDPHGGCSGVVVEYRTRNREVAGSTHTRSTASNLEQVANLYIGVNFYKAAKLEPPPTSQTPRLSGF